MLPQALRDQATAFPSTRTDTDKPVSSGVANDAVRSKGHRRVRGSSTDSALGILLSSGKASVRRLRKAATCDTKTCGGTSMSVSSRSDSRRSGRAIAAKEPPVTAPASWMCSDRSDVDAASSAAQNSPGGCETSPLYSPYSWVSRPRVNARTRCSRRPSGPTGSICTALLPLSASKSTLSSESAGSRQSHHHVDSPSSMRGQSKMLTWRSALSTDGFTTPFVNGGNSGHSFTWSSSRQFASARLPQNAGGGARLHATSVSTSWRSERRSRKSVLPPSVAQRMFRSLTRIAAGSGVFNAAADSSPQSLSSTSNDKACKSTGLAPESPLWRRNASMKPSAWQVLRV
mmetsp:Transcript_50181/g.155037  ORF Transcript_50181/g.155037 Transcript_50181/m.155037 type:complete len:344 (+) Transcript_50181:149-1180(+)